MRTNRFGAGLLGLVAAAGVMMAPISSVAQGSLEEQSKRRQANDEHFGNLVDCIRTRKRPNADIEEGHLSTLLCHYGNIAYRKGRKLFIDPKTEGFKDDSEANALVKRETYRRPWVVPESV